MRRVAMHTLRVAAVVMVFALSLVGSAALHLDTPSCRRLVVDAVNRALAPNLVGKVTIERLDRLGPAGLQGLFARVDDRDGRTLLRLEGVGASIRLGTLLATLIARGSVVVHLPTLAVERADVCLDADEDGTLRLARAFESSTPPSPSGPGKGVHLRLSGIRVAHARVRGEMGIVPPLDGEIDDVGGTFEVRPGALGVHVQSATIVTTRLPGGVTATGAIEAHLALPSPAGGERAITASWQGKVGAVAESAQLTYDGDRIDATLDVPATTPEDVKSLCPGCQLGDVASAHAEAHGKLNDLAVRLAAKVGKGSIDVEGSVSATDAVHGRAHAVLRQVDARALAATGPTSALGADVDATFDVQPSGGLTVESDVDFHGGTLASAPLPAGVLHANVHRGGDGTFSASARGTVDEPGAPTEITASLAPKGASYRVTFEAQSSAIDLARVPALSSTHASGRASASVRGTLAMDSRALDATVESEASGVAVPGAAVRAATLTARITGTASSPTLDAELDSQDVEAGSLHFGSAHAEAHGTPASMPVTIALAGGPVDVDGRATLSAAAPGALRKVAVRIARDDDHADVRAALVRVSGEQVRIDDGEIDGLGRPVRASVQATRGSVRVVAHAGRVDVERVAHLLGVSRVEAGRLDFDVDMLIRGRAAQGHASVGVAGLAAGPWEGVGAHADLQVDGRRISGRATASAIDVGDVDIRADRLEVAGTDALTLSSWRRLFGAATLAGHVDLAELAKRVPGGPSGRLAGTFDLNGRFQRESPSDDTPELDLRAETHGLAFTPAGAVTPRFEGVDLGVQAHIDGQSGKTSVDASLRDVLGPVAALAASSDAVPYGRILTSNERVLDVLRPVPFRASLLFPERDLDALPAAVRPRAVHGRGTAKVTWNGSLLAPTIDAKASARAARTDETVIAMPSDLDVEAHYENGRGELTLRAGSRGRELLKTAVHVEAAAGDLLRATSLDDVPWVASAEAHLSGFPLQSIGALDNRSITGSASGDLTIDGLHRDAKARVSITATDLRVGDVVCKSAKIDGSADGHGLEVSATLAEEDGSASAQVRLGGRWGRALMPSVDASQPAEVALLARQLRAELLLPLLPESTFSELDGRLTGSIDVRIDPKAGTFQPQGTLALTEGTFELPTVGGEFHDARAKLTMSPDGVVRLEDVSARGLSGQIQGAMSLRFNGLAFGGARGAFRVPEKDPLPLVLDGVHLGTVDGSLDIAMDPSPDRSTLDVTVNVPTLHVMLPEVAGHDVQTLGALDGVDVGVKKPDTGFVPTRLDPAGAEAGSKSASGPLLKVTTKLGKDVAVRRGTNLDIRLDGAPTFTMNPSGPTAVGQIRLVRGTIDVEGKSFEIQEGSTVTFVDDPTNPQVVLTAQWKAQDETTTVFADFVGPLKTAKVTLRSEPSLSQSEILSLILFGTSDVNASASSAGSPEASGAAGVAGGAATAPINRALGGLNRMLDNFGLVGGISTKIDTSTTSPRPEVEIQIARDISLQIAWVLGVPPPGTNPDSTLATLSWRFLRKWSLVTTVGDAGTSIVDLVWQKRY